MSTSSRFQLAGFLRPQRGRMALLLGIMLLATASGLVSPMLLQILIDDVLMARQPGLLWWFALGLPAFAVLRFVLSYVQARVYARVTASVLLDLRHDLLGHLLRMPIDFLASRRFGDLMVRFNRDLAQLQDLATSVLLAFMIQVLTLLGTLGLALWYDPVLTGWAIIPLPIALLIAQLFRGRLERQTKGLRERSADLASTVVETVMGAREVRALGREPEQLERFHAQGTDLVARAVGFQATSVFATGLPRLCQVAGTVVIWVLGGRKVISGELPLGELVALNVYIGMVFAPVMALVGLVVQLAQAKVSFARVRELRDLEPAASEVCGGREPDTLGAIAFEDVHFRRDPKLPLLEGIDLRIERGACVALIGESGVGKSTLVDLLYRFLEPGSGRITVDGVDVQELDARAMRSRMALVNDRAFLFHATIPDNVRFGRPTASDSEVDQTLRATGLTRIAERLEHGLDTIVGERGERLSSGERQRVALARALLRQPDILILDEATAALDLESDAELRAGTRTLAAHATTLIISHRPQSLLHVDRVVVLEAGRITREGTPSEILGDLP
jgi:ATP-binding cassette, subfamily B, bacterial